LIAAAKTKDGVVNCQHSRTEALFKVEIAVRLRGDWAVTERARVRHRVIEMGRSWITALIITRE